VFNYLYNSSINVTGTKGIQYLIFYIICICLLGQCNNKECPFLHIDPEQKVKDCAWYDRGFCRHGK